MNRIVPGVLLAGFWLLLLLKGTIPVFCVVVIIFLLLGSDEYCRMTDPRSKGFVEQWSLSFLVVAPAISVCISPDPATLLNTLVVSFLLFSGYFFRRYGEVEDGFKLLARYGFGMLYLGILGGYVVLLRNQEDGGNWLVIASAITACSDSCAYFVGKKFGKRKLCPSVSPNKTIEGAIGGITGGTVAAVVFCWLLLPHIQILFLIPAAMFLCVLGIGGDLLESIVKRGTNTKDSGTCLGGHGGILDRVDSLLFVCPALYFLLPLLN